MGKIKTEGCVTLEFEPDFYEISITVRAEAKTSGAAVTAGKKQTEMLLQALQDELGIQPEQLSAESEQVSVSYNTGNYFFSRDILLTIPADNHVREAVTKLLAEMNEINYNIQAKLTNESKQKQIALDVAVQQAREKAEHLAASMHCKVTAFDELCTDGTSFDENADAVPAYGSIPKECSFAADLQNPKIKITGEVTVVWLTE